MTVRRRKGQKLQFLHEILRGYQEILTK